MLIVPCYPNHWDTVLVIVHGDTTQPQLVANAKIRQNNISESINSVENLTRISDGLDIHATNRTNARASKGNKYFVIIYLDNTIYII